MQQPRNNGYFAPPWEDRSAFADLQGQTLNGVYTTPDGAVWFVASGGTYVMFHAQDCCEGVDLVQIDGDPADMIGAHVTVAEEAEGETPPEWAWEYGHEPESFTWTFYKIQTPRGDLTLRWLGESNGYYSESVDFYRWNEPLPEDAIPLTPDAGGRSGQGEDLGH